MVNTRKVVIVGCGMVGSSIAFALMQDGLFSNMVLIDSNKDKALGEAMDLSHGLPYTSPMEIKAGDYDDCTDASLIIITAGATQKVGETRLNLIDRNVHILKNIIEEIKKRDFKGILLIVANPVDVLTYEAYKISGYSKNRVIGSGTVLDTARLKYLLSKHLNVDSRSVHAFIIGEHGDSELPLYSSANISGIALDDFCELKGFTTHDKAKDEIFDDVKNSAYAIIAKKGSTYYGIAMAVDKICDAIIRDEKTVLPISVVLDGEYGLSNLALALPTIVGKNGAEDVLEIPLNVSERNRLKASANQLLDTIEQIESKD